MGVHRGNSPYFVICEFMVLDRQFVSNLTLEIFENN
eukprot:XP_001704563.1 Hypothetical protein GL50803_37243 [Giardia lamblia ATCC 50803]